MSWFFATVMMLSHFNPLLPKPDDYQSQTKATLVMAYAKACGALFDRPEFKSADIAPLLAQISTVDFSKTTTPDSTEKTDKISPAKLIDLYTKVCRRDADKKLNPDLSALDNYTEEFKTARAYYDDAINGISDADIESLKNLRATQAIDILSNDGKVISEIYKNQNERRKWLTLADIPKNFASAFIAVEDHRFREHSGVDELGLIRAFGKSMMSKGRPEGASTITQQVARNAFNLDKSVSLARKLREMYIAYKIEKAYSKNEILEFYLNTSTYYGRNSWGVEKASETYFGRTAKELNNCEIAYLVGIVKGPAQYQSADSRTVERLNLVTQKMIEANLVPADTKCDFNKDLHFASVNTYHAAYFRDYVADRLGADGIKSAIARGASIKTTIDDKMQTLAEIALQEGLINYEIKFGRYEWRGALANVYDAIKKQKLENEQLKLDAAEEHKGRTKSLSELANGPAPSAAQVKSQAADLTMNDPEWLEPLRQVSGRFVPPMPTWFVAVATPDGYMGTPDGKLHTITQKSADWARGLSVGDVVFVRLAKKQEVEIVQAPKVNGAALAIDPTTGQILAMVGGYNYQVSQYNRVFSLRQPGSLMKPFTYMAGLGLYRQLGIQPNTLLKDGPFLFPPSAKGGQEWAPKNYEGGNLAPHTLMWALENSRNCMTADLMSKTGMEPIDFLAKEFGLYDTPSTNYPFILGAQETTLMQLVRAYAAIDTGILPTITYTPQTPGVPYFSTPIKGVDNITLYQLRFLMQGVLARGTAKALSDLAPYAAGKTGTTENNQDAWFMTYTPHLVLGVFVGYEKPQEIQLGSGATGAAVALPIAEKILRESFNFYHSAEAFAGPPAGVQILNTDLDTGEIRQQPDARTVPAPYRITH